MFFTYGLRMLPASQGCEESMRIIVAQPRGVVSHYLIEKRVCLGPVLSWLCYSICRQCAASV